MKSALKLHSSRGRKQQNRMIVFGWREVSRALKCGIEFDEIFIDESPRHGLVRVIQESVPADTRLLMLSNEVFSKVMFGEREGSVVGVARRPSTELSELSIEQPAFVLVLQAIEKPGNLGAVIRTADACGVSAVLLADTSTDFFHPNSIRASTGAVFGMPVAAASSSEIQSWLIERTIRVLAARVEGAVDLFAADLTGSIAIVLGNEAKGLDHQWTGREIQPIHLPMAGLADSLNVSVTASVMMFEALRQRNNKGQN